MRGMLQWLSWRLSSPCLPLLQTLSRQSSAPERAPDSELLNDMFEFIRHNLATHRPLEPVREGEAEGASTVTASPAAGVPFSR